MAFWMAVSLAALPLAGAFAVPSDEHLASEVVATSAHECCEDGPMAADVVVASAHDCCDHESMPADHVMKECQAAAGCTAKCFNFYAVVFSGVAIPSPIGGTESHFVSHAFHSETASPPFRPPRV
jgi:hypothetical protein